MHTKKLSILLAAVVLIAAQIACAVGEPTLSPVDEPIPSIVDEPTLSNMDEPTPSIVDEPTLSNVRTASDQDGKQLTSTFASTDTVYILADLANGAVGNQVISHLYAENAEGFAPNSFLEETIIDVNGSSTNFIYFYYSSADGLPVGAYKAEVFLNDALIDTVRFTVQ